MSNAFPPLFNLHIFTEGWCLGGAWRKQEARHLTEYFGWLSVLFSHGLNYIDFNQGNSRLKFRHLRSYIQRRRVMSRKVQGCSACVKTATVYYTRLDLANGMLPIWVGGLQWRCIRSEAATELESISEWACWWCTVWACGVDHYLRSWGFIERFCVCLCQSRLHMCSCDFGWVVSWCAVYCLCVCRCCCGLMWRVMWNWRFKQHF